MQFLEQTVTMLKNYLHQTRNKTVPVIDFTAPQDLQNEMDVSIGEQWADFDALLASVQMTLAKSVATQHPRFFNQLYAGADMVGITAELVTAVLNTSMATYETSPVFTIMENEIYSKIARMLQWTQFDGMMLAGWSACNMHAMHVARFRLDYWYHERGLYDSPRLGVFTSDQGHYSITKSSLLMWLGKKSVFKVKSDENGCMIIADLKAKITHAREEGVIPFFINASAWTTVLGAYDPIPEIVAVGEANNMWVHVDATWWWWALFDDSLRHKMPGMESVDSISWNPHKMMGVPLQCSIFMTRHRARNKKCNALNAQYLFNDDKPYDVCYDSGDKYTQCWRRVDVLKVWLQRKSYGDAWLAKRMRTTFANAEYFAEQVKQSKSLLLVQEPTCTNVCFWYLPKDLRKQWVGREMMRQEFDRIHTLTAQIKKMMLECGEMMTTYSPVKDLPNFFRMVFVRHDIDKTDIDFVVDHITELWDKLSDA